jgi:hypothetical protein
MWREIVGWSLATKFRKRQPEAVEVDGARLSVVTLMPQTRHTFTSNGMPMSFIVDRPGLTEYAAWSTLPADDLNSSSIQLPVLERYFISSKSDAQINELDTDINSSEVPQVLSARDVG